MKVTCEEKTIEVDSPRTIYELFEEKIKGSEKNIIFAKCNNIYVPLNFVISGDCELELIDITQKEGMRVYRRGLIFLMEKALLQIYEGAMIKVDYQFTSSLFCKIVNVEVTQEMLNQVEARMKELVAKNLEIKKVQMTKEEAFAFYEKNATNRGRLQTHAKEKEFVSLYYCEDYFNYFYGVMPISTGFMPVFKLEKKNNGFLIRYPSRSNTKEIGRFIENPKLFVTLEEYENLHSDLKIHTVYRLNEAIKEENVKEVILLDEALHEKKISEIANGVAQNQNTKIVLIAGPSSSGKTTFAQRLKLQLKINGLKPITLSVDNYFVEREDTPKDEQGNYDFETIDAIDTGLFNDQLSRLLAGEKIEIPTFDFIEGKKKYTGRTLKLEEDEILVIEGIHCLNDQLTESIPYESKYKIYLSALAVLNVDYYNRISTTDTRLIRRIARDYQFRGYTALHTLQMWDSVNRGERKYVFPYQEEANMMFNSSLIYELGVLKKHTLPLLEVIPKDAKEYPEAMRLYDFLRYFDDIPDEYVPSNSLLREFIGGGVFVD